jgi:ribosome-binding ATPase YchF (GTP1/OBG family)
MVELFTKIKKHLEEIKLLKLMEFTKEEMELIKAYQFLTLKPMMYIANVSENDINTGNEYVETVKKYGEVSHDKFDDVKQELEMQYNNNMRKHNGK